MIINDAVIKIFSLPFFLIIISILAVMSLGVILVKKKVKDEKKLDVIFRILGGVLLALLVASRISHIYHSIEVDREQIFFGEVRKYNWFMLLPNTFCATAALVFSFVLIFGKYKNNKAIDSLFTLFIVGALSNVFYPEYVNRLPFYQARTFCALLYHLLMGFIAILLFITNNYRPKLKNWYYPFLGLSVMMIYAIFTLTVLNFAESFYIGISLIPSLKFTTWYGIIILIMIVDIIFRLIIYKYDKNKEIR